ncbi:acid protease [Laetiporus sulphureus 93-53]|uniref:Acid protease n=1 Tax=Laetiporus sulphureus 93-53 TaxID=1314785 RepID=A0A165F1U4_9APHY|nr:acid protease [Laetiporus sulphureus 93-53]KZT08195.1 acid protease [Laetiporus sulphureus 93-53]
MLVSLFLVFFGAIAATANPARRDKSPISIPFTRKFNATGGATLKQMDRARIAHFKAGCGSGTACDIKTAASTLFDVDATNGAVQYTASVGVGDPATDYTLIIDTGSSNTWVGAGQSYVVTSTSEDTGESVSVTYGSGYFEGEEYLDTVTLASGYAITQQSIGVASYAEGFSGVDGILGLGPEDLTCGTLSDENECIATVTQNAYSQGLIDVEEIGVSFEPTTSDSDTNGVITFGGVDSSLYTGDITYIDITSSSPASEYVGIDQSIQYGSETIMSSAAGIADTGTTLIYLPSSAYNKYVDYTGATYDDNTGLLKISSSDYDSLDSVYFVIGGTSFEFTANAQIWPRSLNTYIGGDSDSIYLVINDMGDDAEEGLEFIDGMTFLERFYFVYNSGSSTVGFATTDYTDATTN